MKKIGNFLNSKKGILVLFSLVYLFVFILNCLTIWAADDYAFYNTAWLGVDKFSFQNIFSKAKWFYFAWTGRFLSTLINYFFLYFPKIIYNFFNSLVYVSIIYIIYKIAKKDNKHNFKLALSICLLVWLLTPSVGQVFFWQIGSVIYSWMYLLILLLIFMYIKWIKSESTIKDNIPTIIGISLLSLAAGNGFETNSIVLICVIFLSLFYKRIFLKEKLPKWTIFGFIFSVFGFLTNFLSPGNSVRMTQMGNEGNLFEKVFSGLGPWFYNGVYKSRLFIVIVLLIFVYSIYLLQSKKKIDKKLIIPFSFISMFVGALAIMISSMLLKDIQTFLSLYYQNMSMFMFLIIILGVFLLGTIISSFLFRKELFKGTNKEDNSIVFILTSSALLGIAAYIMTPTAWPRSYMAMIITLIIAICYLIDRIKIKKVFLNVGLVILVMLSTLIYTYTLYDAYKATKWNDAFDSYVKEQINSGENVIYADTFISNSTYNGASIERWVLPVEVDGEILQDYVWINKEITDYYFKKHDSWNQGKRIIGR